MNIIKNTGKHKAKYVLFTEKITYLSPTISFGFKIILITDSLRKCLKELKLFKSKRMDFYGVVHDSSGRVLAYKDNILTMGEVVYFENSKC